MIEILLGPDGFSKQQYIEDLAKKQKLEPEVFTIDEQPSLERFYGQDLFAKARLVILKDLLAGYEYDQNIAARLAAAKNIVIFTVSKLDKRLTSNKQWLADKSVKVKEFALPHGTQLDKWIAERVKSSGGSISRAAASLLAGKLGRDDARETKAGGKIVAVEEIFDLWQADGEINKLLAYAAGKEITAADVNLLAAENGEADAFELTNAIGDGQKQKTFDLMRRLLKDQAAGDEKGAVIQLNALLSEQFRSVAMVQDFLARKTPDEETLEATGWKAGRLFVMKKIAARFAAKKVIDTLNKLAALDDELKTSQTPPRVVLDLIISQLFV